MRYGEPFETYFSASLNRENEPEPKRLKALSRHLWGTVIVDDLLQAMEKVSCCFDEG